MVTNDDTQAVEKYIGTLPEETNPDELDTAEEEEWKYQHMTLGWLTLIKEYTFVYQTY